MPRRKLTVSDFPPEFLSIWQLAVEGKLSIEMDSQGSARNLIQRLYVFRKRLMEEAPQIAQSFYLVDLRVHDLNGNVISKPTSVPEKAVIKTFVPTWKGQVADLLKKEGVAETVALPLPEVITPSVEIPKGDQLSATLSVLGFGTGDKS